MLFQLLDRVCADINALDLVDSGGQLGLQIRQYAPEAIASLKRESEGHGKPPTDEVATKIVALSAMVFIKAIPAQVRQLVERINDRRLPAARRAAVASVLASLVQKHDTIPDDSPGGYGFLDDAIFLRTGLIQYLEILPSAGAIDIEGEKRITSYLVSLTPSHLRSAIEQGISAMSLAVQIMGFMGDEIAEGILMQLIANPLQPQTQAQPRGFVPRSMPNYEAGRWSGGAYFEGNNVIIPNGPSLINGELFIP